jgi:hypothetical protein
MDMKLKPKYDIALSFAGEDRVYVEQVAMALAAAGVKVFYDRLEEHNLWGKNLYDYLSDVYKNQASFTIMFVSEHYSKKLWTNHERQAAQARAFADNREYVLPARFDDTEIPGLLPTIGHIDLRHRSPIDLVEIIKKKLIDSGVNISEHKLNTAIADVTLKQRESQAACKVFVFSDDKSPITNATVTLVSDNGTYIHAKTNNEGVVELQVPTRRNFTVLVSSPDYQSVIYEKYDPIVDLEIIIKRSDNIGSEVSFSTFYIDGLVGRLNPILDTSNRMYLYADNIAINGGEIQPITFTLNEAITVEDSASTTMKLFFRFIKSRVALVDYIKPPKG